MNAQISYAAGSGQVEIWFEDEAAKELFISSESDILFRGELESELNDGAFSFEFHTLTGDADVSKSLKEINLEEFRYEILTESLAQKDEQIAEIKRSSKAAQLGLAFFFLIIIFGILFPNF